MNNNIDILVWTESVGKAYINARIDRDKHTLEPVYMTDENGNTIMVDMVVVERKEKDTIDI